MGRKQCCESRWFESHPRCCIFQVKDFKSSKTHFVLLLLSLVYGLGYKSRSMLLSNTKYLVFPYLPQLYTLIKEGLIWLKKWKILQIWNVENIIIIAPFALQIIILLQKLFLPELNKADIFFRCGFTDQHREQADLNVKQYEKLISFLKSCWATEKILNQFPLLLSHWLCSSLNILWRRIIFSHVHINNAY